MESSNTSAHSVVVEFFPRCRPVPRKSQAIVVTQHLFLGGDGPMSLKFVESGGG